MSFRDKTLLLLLGLTLLLMYLFKIWITYQLVAMDSAYPQVLQKSEELKKENMQLNDKILESESFMTISDKAKRMGLTTTPFIAP